MLRLLIAGISFFIASTAVAQSYRPDDSSIRCSGNDCKNLIGKRLWVTINHNEICAAVDTDCRKVPPGFGLVVEASRIADDGSGYLLVKGQDGKRGFISLANAHLLTYTNPQIALDAKKKRLEEENRKRQAQISADALALSQVPKEQIEKKCILAAAEHLPRIPGINIISSKSTTVPTEGIKDSAHIVLQIVEIGATAAGLTETYKFLCGFGVRAPISIQRLGV